MYQVFCNEELVHDIRDDTLTLHNIKLNLEVNTPGVLSFVIYDDHPSYFNIQKLRSVITVKKQSRIIFKGRVIEETQGFYREKSIECEGKLAFLNDSIFRPFEFMGSPSVLYRSLIENHNAQVAEFQKFIAGNITVTDPNDYINRSSVEYLNSWKIFDSRLISTLGGYLSIRYEDEGDYLDYLANFAEVSTQIIQFGENLLSFMMEISADETYTAMIPVGAEIQGKRINISSVNGGKDYIINEAAAAKYGILFAPADVSTWEEVTLPANLLKKSREYLDTVGIGLKKTIELSAVDLHLADKEIDSFEFGSYVRIRSEAHGINTAYLLRKIEIDINSPENTRITLGESKRTLTDIQQKSVVKEHEIVNRVTVIENSYLTGESLGDAVDQAATEIVSEAMGAYVKTENIKPGKNIEIVMNQDKSITINADLPDIGSDGFSPLIKEKTNTDTEYKLSVTDINGTYDTPNLKGGAGAAGKSAYQTAVENGYAGTEAEWTVSLNGESGTAASIMIGNVTTGNAGTQANVENVGTLTAAVLNFTIPRGDKGDTGIGGGDGGTSSMFAFEIRSDGHLWMISELGSQENNFYINSQGHLIYFVGG